MSLTVSGMDSGSINTLFSGLSSTSKNASALDTSILGDYYSIRNGSYGKLLKGYYSQYGDSASFTKKVSADSPSNAALQSNSAQALKDSLSALQDSSLYEKKEIKAEDGTTKTDYDKEKIYNALEKFVDSYNDMIDSGEDSSSTGVLTNVSSMVKMTSANRALLSSVGIGVAADNSMRIDKTQFMVSADVSTVKSLFGAAGGYASSLSSNASMVSYYANASTNTGYTASGSYRSTSSSGYSGFA